MSKKLAFLAMVCVFHVSAIGQPSQEDFLLRLEPAVVHEPGLTSATVTAIGEWNVDDDIQGWGWGLCHDPAILGIGDCAGVRQPANPCDGTGCASIACPGDLCGGTGQFCQNVMFHSLNIFDNGITQGIVLDFMIWLPPNSPFEMLTITYDVNLAPGECTSLAFCDTLGNPPVDTTFVVMGTLYPPATQLGAEICSRRDPGPAFVRGDANQDGGSDASDAVAIALAVFGQGGKFALIENCRDSADVDDSGVVDIADAVYLLESLFTDGPAVPEPTTCGVDPTPDALDCFAFVGCR